MDRKLALTGKWNAMLMHIYDLRCGRNRLMHLDKRVVTLDAYNTDCITCTFGDIEERQLTHCAGCCQSLSLVEARHRWQLLDMCEYSKFMAHSAQNGMPLR
mmetsp:Transcript_10588/g.29196  ORF Transcript_10588/g.29196 Transcript_10588/m.29196 type:complete len:101 (+) Transcript_10588:694-996(+)